MAFVIIAASLLLMFAAVTALSPSRRGPFKMLAYPVGWAAGELPGFALVIQLGLLAFLWWWGWPKAMWVSLVVLVIAAVVVIANIVLIGVQFFSRVVVRRAMSHDSTSALRVAPASDDRFGSWYRTLMLVPLHPRSLAITRDVAYGPHRRHRLDVWRQSTTPMNAPVILFVHGGAWTVGDKREQGRPMLHELVSRGWIVVAINYRLAPKDPWPAQIKDVTRALAWVKRSIGAMGGDPDRVVVAGGSAGGHLAALLALSSRDSKWRPQDIPDIDDWSVVGCVSIYGVLETTSDTDVWRGHGGHLRELFEGWVVKQPYVGHEEIYHSMSPFELITETAPPFLVIQGTHDTLVDVNVARSFVARFRKLTAAPIYYVELPVTQHAYDVTASPRTSATTRAVVAFVESLLVVLEPVARTNSTST